MSVKEKLGPSFHRTFGFNRSAISTLLNLAARFENDAGAQITKNIIKKETSLGTQYIDAMPRYAEAAGLLNDKNRLTAFGRRVALHDVLLERSETLWLIHYYLSRRNGSAPRFWGYLFEEVVQPGDLLDRNRIAVFIREVSQSQQSITVNEQTAADAASVFLKTYSSRDYLGALSILQDEGEFYVVQEPESPSALVFAIAVADYWAANLTDATSVWIDAFNQAGGPAQLLLMGSGQVTQAMRELSRMSLATVQLATPPFQFAPLWHSQEELLDRIFVYSRDD